MTTKKDFIVISAIINDAKQAVKQGCNVNDILQFIENRTFLYFKDQNPNFNEELYRNACNKDQK